MFLDFFVNKFRLKPDKTILIYVVYVVLYVASNIFFVRHLGIKIYKILPWNNLNSIWLALGIFALGLVIWVVLLVCSLFKFRTKGLGDVEAGDLMDNKYKEMF